MIKNNAHPHCHKPSINSIGHLLIQVHTLHVPHNISVHALAIIENDDVMIN